MLSQSDKELVYTLISEHVPSLEIVVKLLAADSRYYRHNLQLVRDTALYVEAVQEHEWEIIADQALAEEVARYWDSPDSFWGGYDSD